MKSSFHSEQAIIGRKRNPEQNPGFREGSENAFGKYEMELTRLLLQRGHTRPIMATRFSQGTCPFQYFCITSG